MFLIGERQALKAVKRVDFGMYFAEDGHEDERVLLPKKEVPEDLKIDDTLELFLYKDSNDRLIATRRNPKITVGNIALLSVKQVSKIGAFLDWGLEKDLFLPFKEQTTKLNVGDEVLVRAYIDKSSRICASSLSIFSKSGARSCISVFSICALISSISFRKSAAEA